MHRNKCVSSNKVAQLGQMWLYGLLLASLYLCLCVCVYERERECVREGGMSRSPNHSARLIYLATAGWWSRVQEATYTGVWPPTCFWLLKWTQLSLLNLHPDRRDELLFGRTHTHTHSESNPCNSSKYELMAHVDVLKGQFTQIKLCFLLFFVCRFSFISQTK